MSDLLFSITKDDFVIQTFKAGGKGGQYQNKTDSGVRFIHKNSGAVGEARDSRSQNENKRAAFKRCVESEKFKKWHKLECSRRLGKLKDIEKQTEKSMSVDNLCVEYYDPLSNKWIKEGMQNY